MKYISIVGSKINHLTVLSEDRKYVGGRFRIILNCKCECGNLVIVLKGGRTKSCGCIKRKFKDQYKSKKIRVSWRSMKERCLNYRNDSYKNYGGKGVVICERWMKFINFYNDTESTWEDGLTLDRFPDNRGNYEPNNFRWATMAMQQQNRTNTKLNADIVSFIRNSDKTAKELGLLYCVHEETIRKVRKNIRWQNV